MLSSNFYDLERTRLAEAFQLQAMQLALEEEGAEDWASYQATSSDEEEGEEGSEEGEGLEWL